LTRFVYWMYLIRDLDGECSCFFSVIPNKYRDGILILAMNTSCVTFYSSCLLITPAVDSPPTQQTDRHFE
jgi:hypothetical protein